MYAQQRPSLFRRVDDALPQRRRALRARRGIAHRSPVPYPVVSVTITERYRAVPLDSSDQQQHRVQLARASNQQLLGKLNATGEMTLAANSVATILKDPRLSGDSVLIWDPLTASAAAEYAAGTLYARSTERTAGTWTIRHANSGLTDRTFRYAVLG